MRQQQKGANKLRDLGSGNERKRLRELQKFVQNTADLTVEKHLKKFSKRFSSKKQMKNVERCLDDLEKVLARSSDLDRNKDGFFQLRRR